MKKIIYTLILFFALVTGVNALTYFNVTKAAEGTGPVCPDSKLYLVCMGSDGSTGQGMNFYNVYLYKNGPIYGQTYCMAPSKKNGNGQIHTCERTITPQKKGRYQAFDIAATYAYQKMVNEKIIDGNYQSAGDRVIGTLIFRWLEAYFGLLDLGADNGLNKYSSSNAPYAWENRTSTRYWRQSNSYVRTARRIAEEAQKIGSMVLDGKITYDQLVKRGIIWTDEWDFKLVNTKQEGDIVTIKFDVEPKYGHAPSNVLWKEFNITCENGYKCLDVTKKRIKSANGGYKGRYIVRINVKNGVAKAGQKYGIKITTAYQDLRNPAAYMMIINPSGGTKSYQRMMLIKQRVSTYIIQTDVTFNPPSEECICEEKNGEYTGDYIYAKTEKGITTTEKISKDDERIKSLNCPAKCDKPRKCDIERDKSGKPTYFGNDGSVVDKDTYYEQCLHVCETPDQNEEHVYYCNETEEDKGGEECSEKEYLEDCYCEPLREKCEENPNDPACDEYDEKCPNCNASVSVPGSCNDFNTNSEIYGTINDINRNKTQCNSSINQVKRCVIDGTDQTNESYESTTEIKDNRYCKVWCEESYTFNVPTARYSISGGYFTLSTQISATRNCYVSSASNPEKPIDSALFEEDVKKLNEQISKAYENWSSNKTDSNYKTLSDLNEKMKKTIEEFNKCSTGWKNDMQFDPTIEFSYHEEEYNKISNGKFARSGDIELTTSDTYCLGDTDNQYQCLSGALVSDSDAAPNGLYKNMTYTVCDNNGCKNTEALISQAKWIQKTKNQSAIFTPSQQFSTYHQYGTVKTGTVCENANIEGYSNCLWTRLPDSALPVELKTGKGAFPFVLKFSNIGQSNKDGSLGRLVGFDHSVLNEYNNLPDDKKCGLNLNNNGPKSLTTLDQDAGYVCAYVNNCPECDVSCVGDNCTIKEKEECEGECPVECKNCIFDGTNTTYKFRTVSLNNLFPNSCENNASSECREEGYNWSTLKAQYTKEQIEKDGDTVYDEPEYSYTLTESQKANTREYNKMVGSYANTTAITDNNDKEVALKCDQYTDPDTGLQYSVKCRSTFLENTSGKYFTENVSKPNFVLWLDSDYCLNNNCILSREDGIGPSWK